MEDMKMDNNTVVLAVGALLLGYFAKDIMGPVCQLTSDVVYDLEDDERQLENALTRNNNQKMIQLLAVVLLVYCFVSMNK
jgi:hypothetical protein